MLVAMRVPIQHGPDMTTPTCKLGTATALAKPAMLMGPPDL